MLFHTDDGGLPIVGYVCSILYILTNTDLICYFNLFRFHVYGRSLALRAVIAAGEGGGDLDWDCAAADPPCEWEWLGAFPGTHRNGDTNQNGEVGLQFYMYTSYRSVCS